jgi:hypothetical protein
LWAPSYVSHTDNSFVKRGGTHVVGAIAQVASPQADNHYSLHISLIGEVFPQAILSVTPELMDAQATSVAVL